MPHPDHQITAVLGPTNTGKTHLAIERMLAHTTGVIGLPLRLLAREVYDRVVKQKGAAAVALVTGEERIVPARPRYWIATVEAMPLDLSPAFLAVDEIQLVADRERGHVFTDRLLHARGEFETMFMGAATVAPLIRHLLPDAEIVTRPRFSDLLHTGHKKLTRLPRRSAVVGFSAGQVYAMAELIRRQRGGAAVVLGALSPRTRNAQVALYQSGEVDFLVATDAIGMGLNLDVKHVAFAGLEKFDGISHRHLAPAELSQIAGRAGRFRTDGTFGTTASAPSLEQEVVQAIESHSFKPLTRAQWRSRDLDFRDPYRLIRSLEAPTDDEALTRTRELIDVRGLKAMAERPLVTDRTFNPALTRLLWECCQVPDYRQTMEDAHMRLVETLFKYLTTGNQKLPEDWIAGQVGQLDRLGGDIDALSARIAHIRTWTYISHRQNWFEDAAHWQGVTRAIEDRLSDALHERLTQRFVDRRTSVLMKKLKEKDRLMGSVSADGTVTVEGQLAGQIKGLRFTADDTDGGMHSRTLNEAASGPVAEELRARASRLLALFDAGEKAAALIGQTAAKPAAKPEATDAAAASGEPSKPSLFKPQKAPKAPVSLNEAGEVVWDGEPIAMLEKGAAILRPQIKLLADELLDAATAEKLRARLVQWLDEHMRAVLAPLYGLEEASGVEGTARGIAFQLVENLGVLGRDGDVAEQIRNLDQEGRAGLRALGVRFGELTIYQPALLKPQPAMLKLVLWRLFNAPDSLPEVPTAGLCSAPAEKHSPKGFYEVIGFRQTGRRIVRIDMLERLADMLRPLNAEGPFEVTSDHMSIVGCSGDDFTSIMLALGYRSRTVPKPAEQAAAAETPAEETPAEETPAEETAPEAAAAEEAPAVDAGAEAPAEEAPVEEAPAVEVAAEAEEPAEPETITLWRLKRGARSVGEGAPSRERRPNRTDDRRPRRDDAKDGDRRGPKGHKGKGGKPKGKGGPKTYEARAPRKEKKADPDSPFAVLAALKDK